jgi:hypothetical protein
MNWLFKPNTRSHSASPALALCSTSKMAISVYRCELLRWDAGPTAQAVKPSPIVQSPSPKFITDDPIIRQRFDLMHRFNSQDHRKYLQNLTNLSSWDGSKVWRPK